MTPPVETGGHGTRIDISVVVTTFRRPRHLLLVLESLSLQEDAGVFEAIVADDGSDDGTQDVVAAFAATAPFAVRFTTEPHDGFRLARTRNRAARLACGRYLVFLDGDCMVPRHHMAAHRSRRRPGAALLGHCAWLPEVGSRGLLPGSLRAVDLAALAPAAERRRLGRRHRRSWLQTALRHPTKPRLAGGDFGVWRTDFELVNGFDERFVGWGQEDDDLGLRLRAAGIRLDSILDRTRSLHVWHPTDATAPRRWRDGPNVGYFERRGRLTVCRRGLAHRGPDEILWGLPPDLGATALGRLIDRRLRRAPRAGPREPCEVDVVIRPGCGTFVRDAECRLLVTAPGAASDRAIHLAADQVAVVDDAADLRHTLDTVG